MFDTRENRVPVPLPRGWAVEGGPPVDRHAVALSEVMLISADHSLRSTWAQKLRRLGIAMSVSEATSLHDARARLGTGECPELILLDADLAVTPGNGQDPESVRAGCVAALGVLRRQHLVMIGIAPETVVLRSLLESGARGYLFGGRGEPGADADAVRSRRATVIDTGGVPRDLSLREVEVLQHAADGHTNIEIGLALHVSPLTVKSHLGRIGRRLGSGDRAHLVLLALRSGVVR